MQYVPILINPIHKKGQKEWERKKEHVSKHLALRQDASLEVHRCSSFFFFDLIRFDFCRGVVWHS